MFTVLSTKRIIDKSVKRLIGKRDLHTRLFVLNRHKTTKIFLNPAITGSVTGKISSDYPYSISCFEIMGKLLKIEAT